MREVEVAPTSSFFGGRGVRGNIRATVIRVGFLRVLGFRVWGSLIILSCCNHALDGCSNSGNEQDVLAQDMAPQLEDCPVMSTRKSGTRYKTLKPKPLNPKPLNPKNLNS